MEKIALKDEKMTVKSESEVLIQKTCLVMVTLIIISPTKITVKM